MPYSREYACRAGTTTEFSFGNDEHQLIHHGWYAQNASINSHAVDQFPLNAWGLFDMHGNVWQWCQDLWNKSYKGAPLDGSAWMTGGDLFGARHVLRGGSWYANATWCRCATRYRITPDIRFGSYGFRIALSQSPTSEQRTGTKP